MTETVPQPEGAHTQGVTDGKAGRFLWMPAFLVGISLATTLGTAAGILLYNAAGMIQAGGVVLSVVVFSFLVGLWTSTRERDEVVTTTVSWWVGFLVALALSAAYVGVWELLPAFRASFASQPLGLGFVCALPSYFAGGLMGLLGHFAGALAPRGLRRRVVLGAIAGLVIGGVGMWFMLGRILMAVTAVLAAAILASLGARILSWIVDRVPRRRLVLSDSDRPDLRFDVWSQSVPKGTTHVFWDGSNRRLVVPAQDGTWVDAVRAFEADQTGGLFFVGVGGWWHPEPSTAWWVHEPDDSVLELVREGLGWSPENVLPTPEPPEGTAAAVLDRDSLATLFESGLGLVDYIRILEGLGVKRVWIGGDRTAIPQRGLPVPPNGELASADYVARVPSAGHPLKAPPRIQNIRLFQLGPAPAPFPDRIGPFSPAPTR